jgi:hypothetical protein
MSRARGVAYANTNVTRQFGGNTAGDNRASINFRGSGGNQVLKLNAKYQPWYRRGWR